MVRNAIKVEKPMSPYLCDVREVTTEAGWKPVTMATDLPLAQFSNHVDSSGNLFNLEILLFYICNRLNVNRGLEFDGTKCIWICKLALNKTENGPFVEIVFKTGCKRVCVRLCKWNKEENKACFGAW